LNRISQKRFNSTISKGTTKRKTNTRRRQEYWLRTLKASLIRIGKVYEVSVGIWQGRGKSYKQRGIATGGGKPFSDRTNWAELTGGKVPGWLTASKF